MTVKERTEARGLGARRMLSYRTVSALARLMLCAVISCTLIAALPGCGGSSAGSGTAEALPSSGSKGQATGADFVMPAQIVVPTVADSGGATTIDTSGVNQGWVGARGHSGSRLKFQVTQGEMTYNYDLPNDGTPACFPINMGNGPYLFRVMENIEGSTYAELDSAR